MRGSIGITAVTTAAIFLEADQVDPGSLMTLPLPSITAEMPMLTARAMLRRHSTARNRQMARCCSCSLVPANQPSLEILIRKSTGSPGTLTR